MCFQAPFGTKTLYEKKVPVKIRKDFDKYIMRRHNSDAALSEFGAAWREWLGEHQAELSDMDSDSDSDNDDNNKKPKRFSTSAFGVVGSDSEPEDATPHPSREPTPEESHGAGSQAKSPAKSPAKAAPKSPAK
jgi:hypothetical protein